VFGIIPVIYSDKIYTVKKLGQPLSCTGCLPPILTTRQINNILSDRSDICEAAAISLLCKIERVNAEFRHVAAVVDSGFCSGLVTEPSSPVAEGSGGGGVEEEEEEVGDCPSVEDASNIIIPKCQNCQKCKVRTVDRKNQRNVTQFKK
jgi:hypothetical protein